MDFPFSTCHFSFVIAEAMSATEHLQGKWLSNRRFSRMLWINADYQAPIRRIRVNPWLLLYDPGKCYGNGTIEN